MTGAEILDVRGAYDVRYVRCQTTVGLGTHARLPFRVTVLQGPGSGSRLVVDVAHRW